MPNLLPGSKNLFYATGLLEVSRKTGLRHLLIEFHELQRHAV